MTPAELAMIARQTPGTDCLEEHGLHEDAETLRAATGKAELLERAVAALEWAAADAVPLWMAYHQGLIELIAEHRGETVKVTLARLSPPTRITCDRCGATYPGSEPACPGFCGHPAGDPPYNLNTLIREGRIGPR